jgi:hypothetical protein
MILRAHDILRRHNLATRSTFLQEPSPSERPGRLG